MSGAADSASTMSFPSPVVPVELYRNIVSHIGNRRDLFFLSLSSRALGYEAERILYGTLSFGGKKDVVALPRFLECKRAHQYVLSLQIEYPPPSDAKHILEVLQAVNNLKSLRIYVAGKHIYLPQRPLFQLHTFSTNHPADLTLKSFLRSQQEITTLDWYPSNLFPGFFRPHDLPAIRYLASNRVVLGQLPNRPIRCLKLPFMSPNDMPWLENHFRQAATVIYSLMLCQLDDRSIKQLAEIFPNLRFLEVEGCQEETLIPDISKMRHLEKIKFKSAPIRDLASRLFACHSQLKVVEMQQYNWGTYQFRCVSDQPFRVLPDDDEWKRW